MRQYLPVLLILACPVGMGLMMWFMMRGRHGQSMTQPSPVQPSPAQQEEIAMLRAEIATLREQQQRPTERRPQEGHDIPGTQP